MKLRHLLIRMVIVLLAACSSAEDSGVQMPATAAAVGGMATGPGPETATSPEAFNVSTGVSIDPVEEVAIPADGGLTLAGDFYSGQGAGPRPGVLLLHMAYRNREDWAPFAIELAGQGYGTLAIDLRGHGTTGGEIDWEQSVEDARLAVAYLRSRADIDPQQIAVVGASFGANLAANVAAGDPTIRGAALLSPGVGLFRVSADTAIENYGNRPLFIAASRDDKYAADSSEELAELATGTTQLEWYPSAGHGTEMLTGAPDLPGKLMDWLALVLEPDG